MDSLLFLEEIFGICGDELVLCWGGDDTEGDVVLAGKKDSFADLSTEEKVFFSLREVEDILEPVGGTSALFHQHLDTGVGDDGLAVVGLDEVFDVLSDRGEAKVVFAGALGDGIEERGGVFVFHEIPCLVDDEKSFFEVSFDLSPDVVKDDKDGGRPKLVLEVADPKDRELVTKVDVAFLGENSLEAAFDEFF